MIDSILVLCIGNICRSPMAEGLLKAALPGLSIRSAGLQAMVGHAADPIAIELMREHGLDIIGHVAQSLNLQLVTGSQLILTMDREQKQMVESRYPVARGRVHRLGEFDGVDIADPYRRGRESFETAFALISDGVAQWARRIEQLTQRQTA